MLLEAASGTLRFHQQKNDGKELSQGIHHEPSSELALWTAVFQCLKIASPDQARSPTLSRVLHKLETAS